MSETSKKRKQRKELIELDSEPPTKKKRTKKSKKTKSRIKDDSKDTEKRKKKRKRSKKSETGKEKEGKPLTNRATEDLTEADKAAILLAQQEFEAMENTKKDEPVDFRECVSCKDWMPVGDMYFLDMCSHRYCKNCWSKYCSSFGSKKDKENSKSFVVITILHLVFII